MSWTLTGWTLLASIVAVTFGILTGNTTVAQIGTGAGLASLATLIYLVKRDLW